MVKAPNNHTTILSSCTVHVSAALRMLFMLSGDIPGGGKNEPKKKCGRAAVCQQEKE